MAGAFQWFGDKFAAFVGKQIDDRLHKAGRQIVARAQQLAPVKTGALRDSILYVVAESPGLSGHILSIQVGMPYGIFQEFGTRNMPPHPYIRPALNEIGRIFGGEVQMQFASPGTHGLLAGTGAGVSVAGFAATAHPAFRPLTQRQITHVKGVLIPSVKRLHRGNVKRARFIVR